MARLWYLVPLMPPATPEHFGDYELVERLGVGRERRVAVRVDVLLAHRTRLAQVPRAAVTRLAQTTPYESCPGKHRGLARISLPARV